MANFGDNMREWVKSNYESKEERYRRIIRQEFEKATKDLVTNTPEGQIRFEVIPYTKIKKKIALALGKISLDPIMCKLLHDIEKENHFFISLPEESSDLRYMGIDKNNKIIFYANNIRSNPNCAKDLVTYWFENFVLPEFERLIKLECVKNRFSESSYSIFSFDFILSALDCYNLPFEAIAVVKELCVKHAIKLIDLRCFSDDHYGQICLSIF